MPDVSIITVHYNTPEDVLRLSDSVARHLPASLYEWIVADNDAQVNLADRLPGARYLRLPSNAGFGAACNRAAEAASAPALFFVNPDCVFVEDCVTPLLAALQRAAVCGPRVLYPEGELQLSFGPYLSIRSEHLQRRRMRAETTPGVQEWIAGLGEFEPDYVSGCALMTRKDVFRKAGGFDEEFFLYHEDVDLCKRIHDMGERILYVPSARIIHEKNRSVRQTPDRVRKEYRKSQIHYYRKHHGAAQNLMLRLYLLASGKNP